MKCWKLIFLATAWIVGLYLKDKIYEERIGINEIIN